MKVTKIKGFRVWFENAVEFHTLKREVFGAHQYFAEFDRADPLIIDAGAHIGLATLYFKMIAPGARIVAIEPNPEVVPILKKNIFDNLLEEVEVVEVALGESDGEREFFIDDSGDGWFSAGGFTSGAWNKSQKSRSIKVETITLARLLEVLGEIDLLKMDIEGAEMRVLLSAGETIQKIKHLLVEFHGVGDNSCPKIVEFLEGQGFEVVARQNGREVKPERVRGLALVEGMSKSNGE